MADSYSHSLANTLQKKFSQLGIHPAFDQEHGAFYFSLRLQGKVKALSCAVLVRDTEYILYMTSPIAADIHDPIAMSQLSELLHRINRTVSRGCFELDFEDGDIRYKIFADCSVSPVTKTNITKTILIPSFMFLAYSDSIYQVLFNKAKAKDIPVQRPTEFAAPMIENFSEILRKALSDDEEEDSPNTPLYS